MYVFNPPSKDTHHLYRKQVHYFVHLQRHYVPHTCNCRRVVIAARR